MPESVRIGLLDSGLAVSQEPYIAKVQRFFLNTQGRVASDIAKPDRANHGAALAEVIIAHAPQVRLLNAQVFNGSRPSSAAVIAAALDWLVAEGARVVNMSFGLREDRTVLCRACGAAVAAGVVVVCSTPVRGGLIYPAAYSGMLRVCGDARCAPGELSALPDGPAHLGACPRPHGRTLEDTANGGASFGAAHVTGLLAAFFVDNPDASRRAAMQHLESLCCFHGRERRS